MKNNSSFLEQNVWENYSPGLFASELFDNSININLDVSVYESQCEDSFGA